MDLMEGSIPSKTKKGKRPVREEPVVDAPASPARVNVERMNVRLLDHASAQGEHY
jgi:hypothetical protein